MFKRAMLILGLFFMTSSFAYAEETYSISGQITISGHENVYISIYTIEGFPQYKKSLPSPPFFQKITPNPEQTEAGIVPFTFSGIPKGSYCIIAFRDLDNNGTLNADTWGQIQEPICYYKESSSPWLTANWNDVKFELVSDITGISMKLE